MEYETTLVNTVAIIGAGAWGTAVAKSIAEARPQVTVRIWAHEKSVVSSINRRGENKFLPGIKLPRNVTAYAVLPEALEGAEAVLIASPSRFLYETALRMARHVTPRMHIGFLTKGFCKVQGKILTISQAIERAIPQLQDRVVAVSGPSHAEEVSRGFHTCLNVASRSAVSRAIIADLLTTDVLRCRETDDIRGVEVGGTLKNPAAIAAGMISVLPQCGDNLSGALISEALKEMIRLGALFRIGEEAMTDISGLGDLVATAMSRHSRNRRFGSDIARQMLRGRMTLGVIDRVILRFRPKSVIERMSRRFDYLAEGAYAIEPLIELAESGDVSIPLYRALYEVLLNRRDPSLLIETIKSPHRFNELYNNIGMQLIKRKKGLEGVSGRVFGELIIGRVIGKFTGLHGGRRGAYEPDEVIRNLREFHDPEIPPGGGKLYARAQSIAARLSKDNYAESIRLLAGLYLESISDNFYRPLKWLFNLYALFTRIMNFFLRRRSRITVTGHLKDIRGAVNVQYASTFAGVYDFVLIIVAILRKGLPFPRFFMGADSIDQRSVMLYRRLGGFCVDRNMLENLLYRETLCQYLTTLSGHGVPILYFPFHSSGMNSDSTGNEFFSALGESLLEHTAAAAVVPVELSYHRKPARAGSGGQSFGEIIASVVSINFSKPLYLSEHVHDSSNLIGIAGLLKSVWLKDRKVFPHYVLSRVLARNNYRLELDSAAELVEGYLSSTGGRLELSPSAIVKRGLNFLVGNGSIEIRNGHIVAVNTGDIEFYSDMMA